MAEELAVTDIAEEIPLHTDVSIINVLSQRSLYAKEGLKWEDGVGAGSPISAVHADGVWHIVPERGGFRIINQQSQRSLYAKEAKTWEAGVGAGSPPSAVHFDGLWDINVVNDGYRIVNKQSLRSLYAKNDKNWEVGVGAGFPESAVHADGVWHIVRHHQIHQGPSNNDLKVLLESRGCSKDLRTVHFPMMAQAEVCAVSLEYSESSNFTDDLRETLATHGMAIVNSLLSPEECSEYEEVWKREQTGPTPQPKELGDLAHAHGELAWKARLHPKVKHTFATIFQKSPEGLSVGTDKVFFTPEGTPSQHVNHQWLHVDQNHRTGLKHLCYQGVLYVRASDESSSTTALWPGSHKPDVYEDKMMTVKSPQQFIEVRETHDGKFEREAIAGTRRVPVPAGALLLWDSRLVHQGWQGGPRLAVPVCWEPRERVDDGTRDKKMRFALAGVATSHSPSEGRMHPSIKKIHTPVARPFSVKMAHELDARAWHDVCANESASTEALAHALRPEVAAAL